MTQCKPSNELEYGRPTVVLAIAIMIVLTAYFEVQASSCIRFFELELLPA
jgi:hypothetical protein